MKGCVVILLAIAVGCFAAPAEKPTTDCGDKSQIGAASEDARVSPDYLAGPWLPLDPEYAFHPLTNRPRVLQALKLLHEVAESVSETTRVTQETRDAKLAEENRLISEGQDAVSRLTAEIANVAAEKEAHEKIVPTQTSIINIAHDGLAPSLARLAELYQLEADIRFPFAERLASFSMDLQKVVRAREEAACRLKDYVPAADLSAQLATYTDMTDKLQRKISSEIGAASEVLNPNQVVVQDTLAQLASHESKIANLRDDLALHFNESRGYVPHELGVKQAVRSDEQALVDAVTTAAAVQNALLDHFKSVESEQQQLVRHTATILGGLLMDQTAEQSALEPLKAKQRSDVSWSA